MAARVIERRNLTAVTDDFAIAVQTGGRLHVPTVLEDGLPNESITPTNVPTKVRHRRCKQLPNNQKPTPKGHGYAKYAIRKRVATHPPPTEFHSSMRSEPSAGADRSGIF